LKDVEYLLPAGVADLDVDLGELHQMPARRRGFERFEPDVGRDVEDLVERQQRRLLVQDHARHDLVVVAVEVDVELLGSAHARIGPALSGCRQNGTSSCPAANALSSARPTSPSRDSTLSTNAFACARSPVSGTSAWRGSARATAAACSRAATFSSMVGSRCASATVFTINRLAPDRAASRADSASSRSAPRGVRG